MAAAQVFTIPELAEHILRFAGLGDILRFQRVNNFFRNVIQSSKILRETLFDHIYYPPNEVFANARMIKVLPPKVMSNGEHLAICVRVQHNKVASLPSSACSSKDSSWRPLHTSLPPVRKLTGFSPCYGVELITAQAASNEFLTLGDLHDTVAKLASQHGACGMCEKKGSLEVHFARLSQDSQTRSDDIHEQTVLKCSY